MTRRKKTTGKVDFFLGERDLDVLPHDASTEQIVLGAVMSSAATFNECYKFLAAPGLFYGDLQAEIWSFVASAASNNQVADLQAVKAYLNSKGRTQDALSVEWWVTESVSYQSRIKHLCLRLNEYWIRRSIHRMGHELNVNALKDDCDPMDLLGKLSEGNSAILQHITGMKEPSTADISAELMAQIQKMQQGARYGLQSSVPDLDAITRGYQNSELTIIGAGTGEGKSTLAFQEIDFQASQGNQVGVVLLEMTKLQMVLLMACAREKIDVRKVKTPGSLSSDELSRLNRSIQAVGRLPIHVIDTPGLRMGEIKAIFRRWKKQHEIKAGYIDHLHLARHDDPSLVPEQAFTGIANESKELAKELDIPMIALGQLARRANDQKRRKHEVTDLKYAGGIEQAADCVLLVYRWEKHGVDKDEDGNSTKGKALIQVAKLRMMEPKDVPVFFSGQRFLDVNDPAARTEPVFLYENPRAGISPRHDDDTLPF